MYNLGPIKEVLSNHGYEYAGFLGRGGFSNVFLCKSKNYNHAFAVKRAFRHKMTKLEFKNMISLNHPNIVKLYDAFDDDISQYLVMEYCSNGTIYQKGRLSYEKFVFYARQIIEALVFCHANNIAHRDIKPENVLIDQFDHIKLADFGLSKQFDINENSTDECGSLLPFPQEMFQKEQIDPFKADIYDLGITFYYMATGSCPYQRIQLNDIKKTILSGELFSPKFNIHPKIKQLIDKMIDKNSNERLSAEKLLDLPIFASKLTRRSSTVYQNPTFITQTSLNLNSSLALNLNQHPTQPTDILTYRSINNPKIVKLYRHFQPQNTF